jgi:hypothetical protein
MVKVTLGEQPAQSEKPFPKLMKRTTDDSIFYFFKPRVGLPLTGTNPECFSDKWASSWIMDFFTDYNEPITLQNA